MPETPSAARIEYLRIKNYRALHDLEFKHLDSLTALLGQNGSGKSTVFDVFAFLSECFGPGLRAAWEKRNRFEQLRTRGAVGPITIQIKYREVSGSRREPLITYHLSIDETDNGPVVAEEWLSWKRQSYGAPFRFMVFHGGKGEVVSGEAPDAADARIEAQLDSDDLLAVNALGQFTDHPRVSALRRFIRGWHLSYLSAQSGRDAVQPGPQSRLSTTGDNLPNVIQFLKERQPGRLDQIFATLARRIPRLESVSSERMPDGRMLLQLKDAPFDSPIMAKFASDGTLKMLAYLVLLSDMEASPLIGIEEPENYLFPQLLSELAEECQLASVRSQLFVSSHSPFLVNGFRPEQVWVLDRDRDGYTRATRSADIPGVQAQLDAGARLGSLWMEGFLRSERRSGEAR